MTTPKKTPAAMMRRLRHQRTRKGRCPECGRKCKTYRCNRCNEYRREPMRLLQQRAKVRRLAALAAAGTEGGAT